MKAFFLFLCLTILKLKPFCFNSLISFVKFFKSVICKLNIKLIKLDPFSVISTLVIFNLLLPINVVTSPSFPGESGNDNHKPQLYTLYLDFFVIKLVFLFNSDKNRFYKKIKIELL